MKLEKMNDNPEDNSTVEPSEVMEETAADTVEAEDTETVAEEVEASAEDGQSGDAAEAEEAEEAPQADSENGKGSIFKKKKKKDPKDDIIEDLQDKYKRQMAEFDNFRKRTEKEKSAMYEVGAKSIIEKILPVVDNFERGFATLSEEEKATPFADGMDKVFKQMQKSLEEMGVKPIEAVGKEFDPNFHNAVMHIDDEAFGENTVAEEFQKGYTYRDTVVRHSMVKVAN